MIQIMIINIKNRIFNVHNSEIINFFLILFEIFYFHSVLQFLV